MSILYFFLVFAAGATCFYYFQKFGIRWTGKQKSAAQSVLRGLSHDAFLTFYSAAVSEAKRRNVQPTAEEVGRPSRSTEASD